MSMLTTRRAFLHVIDAHRWLAASGCNWNLLRANDSPVRACADRLLPNVDVAIRDCILLHARSLIDFYTVTRTKKNKKGPRPTDILLCDFQKLSIGSDLVDSLLAYKTSIEVHLLHLTDWRDCGYRAKHATGNNAKADRKDWDKEVKPLVERILEALEDAANNPSSWRRPFQDLHKACTTRYRDQSYQWPKELGEKADVDQYLQRLGP